MERKHAALRGLPSTLKMRGCRQEDIELMNKGKYEGIDGEDRSTTAEFIKRYRFAHEWFWFYEFPEKFLKEEGLEPGYYYFGIIKENVKKNFKDWIKKEGKESLIFVLTADMHFIGVYGAPEIYEGEINLNRLLDWVDENDPIYKCLKKYKEEKIINDEGKEMRKEEKTKALKMLVDLRSPIKYSILFRNPIKYKQGDYGTFDENLSSALVIYKDKYITDDQAINILLDAYKNEPCENKIKILRILQEKFDMEMVKEKAKEKGIDIEFLSLPAFLPESHLKNLLVSALAKPFVILAGITGTGKSFIAREFAKAIGAEYLMVPVRPDWNDPSALIGYKNVLAGKEGEWISTPFLEFILAANAEYKENKKDPKPYVIILDEMNLARVEYYFSDFLSVLEDPERKTTGMNIESGIPMRINYKGESEEGWKERWLRILIKEEKLEKLKEVNKKGKKKENKEKWEKVKKKKDLQKGECRIEKLEFPSNLPPNLIVIGTVNMDETTYAFSPKVLDRANTIEFVMVDLDKYWEKTKEEDVQQCVKVTKPPICFFKEITEFMNKEDNEKGNKKEWRKKLLEKVKTELKNVIQPDDKEKGIIKILNDIEDILVTRNFHFAYRTFEEILFYLYWWYRAFIKTEEESEEGKNKENKEEKPNDWWCEPLDFQILQKILPKIGGDVQRVGDVIDRLMGLLIRKGKEISNKELFKDWIEKEKVKPLNSLKIKVENKEKDPFEVLLCALKMKDFGKNVACNQEVNEVTEELQSFPFLRSLYKLLRMKERLEKFGTTSFYEY